MQHTVPEDYVAIAEHICPVCGTTHTFNTEILIHKNLRSIPEDKRCIGYGLCESHQKLFDENYIACVVATNAGEHEKMQLDEAIRTGEIFHLKKTVFNEIFDIVLPDNLELTFITPEVATIIKQIPTKRE